MAFLTAADCGGCLAVTQQCQDCEAGCKADHIRQAQIESSVTEDSVGAASLKLVVVVMWPGGQPSWWWWWWWLCGMLVSHTDWQ